MPLGSRCSIGRQTGCRRGVLEAVGAYTRNCWDPRWQQTAGTMPHHDSGIHLHTAIEVQSPGHRLGARLLQPASVIMSA